MKNKKEEVLDIIFPGSFDPFHSGHKEALELAEAYFKQKITIVIIQNKSKNAGKYTLEERKVIIEKICPENKILIAEDEKKLQALWEQADVVIRKYRGAFDEAEDRKACEINGVKFEKIKYFELKEFADVSSLKLKIGEIIGEDFIKKI